MLIFSKDDDDDDVVELEYEIDSNPPEPVSDDDVRDPAQLVRS